ncbi:hypothetical protein AVEN_219621-1 [Araneus ventricosus]|uniref:Uncharacterized protein n=1 Tax=Araneus ventricosus TaxID=182803 RepID=A0A4Y2LL48_ARAVE|nr:hypothetical protein AVEN_219621-1 [Araneus ventricosus]
MGKGRRVELRCDKCHAGWPDSLHRESDFTQRKKKRTYFHIPKNNVFSNNRFSRLRLPNKRFSKSRSGIPVTHIASPFVCLLKKEGTKYRVIMLGIVSAIDLKRDRQ